MNSLSKYGISPTDSATSLLHTGLSVLKNEEFFVQAKALLQDLQLPVEEEILPHLEKYDGRWHPSGFMVYALGTHPQLGDLRLHIWPQNLRRRLLKGREKMGDIYDGDIHNHAWDITSITMTHYRDNLYKVERVADSDIDDAEFHAKGFFRIFNVSYQENARQSLVTNGVVVSANVIETRETQRGDILNTMHTTVFHAPIIADDMFGCTLVFDSIRMTPDGPDILIGGSTDPIYDTRRPVSAEDAILVKNQYRDLKIRQSD